MKINSYEELILEYPALAAFERHDAILMAYLTGHVDGRSELLERLDNHKAMLDAKHAKRIGTQNHSG